jgi:anhydro-N-acetylmuramic acid kinase
MDGLVRHFTRGGKHYDAGGRLAAGGKVIDSIVQECLRLPFFCRRPPKSAGREEFGSRFVGRYFLGRSKHLDDLLRTAVELTACSIAGALKRFVFPHLRQGKNAHRLVVSGGGAHNRVLLRRLQEILPELRLQVSDDYGLPADAKEAVAFAVLADRTLHGLSGNLPSVTGAAKSVVLGKLVRV